MPAKPRATFRLPERTRGQLEDLVIPGRRTMTDAVIIAVDLLHGRAAHDDAVDLLIDELRLLRQESEKHAQAISALAAQVRTVDTIAGSIEALSRSIDRLGEHQVQLAEAVNTKVAQPAGGGLFGRR